MEVKGYKHKDSERRFLNLNTCKQGHLSEWQLSLAEMKGCQETEKTNPPCSFSQPFPTRGLSCSSRHTTHPVMRIGKGWVGAGGRWWVTSGRQACESTTLAGSSFPEKQRPRANQSPRHQGVLSCCRPDLIATYQIALCCRGQTQCQGDEKDTDRSSAGLCD